jgi:predicted Rossmann fold flavoprotein
MPEQAAAEYRVAVVGGGAAGLMAALAAALAWSEWAAASAGSQGSAGATHPKSSPLRPVVLLEKQDRVGRKLLATGNGQCNLGNQDISMDHYHGGEAAFISTVLGLRDAPATRDFFEQLGLPLRAEPDGRLYPYSRQAAAVLDFFRLTAAHLGVQTETGYAVTRIEHERGRFSLAAADGRTIRAQRVVVATGGLAAPALGADGQGYSLLTRLGHHRTDCFPAIVPLRIETGLVRGLAGCKFDGAIKLEGGGCQAAAEGEILFAEYGLSGPAVLQVARDAGQSLLRQPAGNVDAVLDFLPEWTGRAIVDFLARRQKIDPQLPLADFLTGLVHKKIGQALVKQSLRLSLNQPAGNLARADLQSLAGALKALRLKVSGTRDWQQAQVTAGGLAVHEFKADSLESRLVAGLYAAGEMLDVDGDCGGYNLQWAWSSGYLAGRRAMLD